MWHVSSWLIFLVCAAGSVIAIADGAQANRLVFLSTQLRPLEETQKMRDLTLKGFPREVDYITEQPQQLPVRIKIDQQRTAHEIDVVGALHGELQPFVALDALVPLDDLAGKLGSPSRSNRAFSSCHPVPAHVRCSSELFDGHGDLVGPSTADVHVRCSSCVFV